MMCFTTLAENTKILSHMDFTNLRHMRKHLSVASYRNSYSIITYYYI